jgi:hypothetical protein
LEFQLGVAGAADEVPGVFHFYHFGLSRVIDGGAEFGFQAAGGEDAPLAWYRDGQTTRHRRGPGQFVVDDVGALVGQDLVAPAAGQVEGDQVSHGPGGNKEGRFLAQHFGSPLLQLADAGVLQVDVVPHRGIVHGFFHPFGGKGYSIGFEVDDHGALLGRPSIWAACCIHHLKNQSTV